MNDELNLQMFKAYDIRTVSTKLNKENTERLLRSVAKYYLDVIKTDSLVIGRDARLAAPSLMQAAVDMFPLYGLNVILNPLQVSTCQFYYSCMQNRKSGGIMFTASHNPGVYIGLKLLAPNMETLAMGCGPQGGITAIKQFYIENVKPSFAKQRGKVIIKRYLDEFIDYSLSYAGVEKDSLKGSKILTDYLSGAVGTEMSEALSYAGADLRSRNLIPDGYFPQGDPNPIVISSVQKTWDLMKSGNFDFGFCFDGDGDRMDVMYKTGVQIAPCFNMAALMGDLKKIYKKIYESGFYGKDVPFNPHSYADVKANPLAMVQMAKAGVDIHIIRNGHSFIKQALTANCKNQYMGASEESAHYYLNFPYDLKDYSKGFASTENTLFFTLLTSKIWVQHPEVFDKIMETQEKIYREREWPLFFKDESKMEESLKRVEKYFTNEGLSCFKEMEDKSSLDATILRYGLPEIIKPETDLSGEWYQIAQRISRSEDGIARWELVGSKKDLVKKATEKIKEINQVYVDEKKANYL